MPTAYESLLFSRIAYSERKDSTFLELKALGWQWVCDSNAQTFDTEFPNNHKLGYRGLCFTRDVGPGEKEVVIAHRGELLGDRHNLFSDFQAGRGELPRDSQVALSFSNHCLSQLDTDVTTIARATHIGHSLGGVHAHVCAHARGESAIGLDHKGVAEILSHLKAGPSAEQRSHHLSLLSEANAENVQGTHYGLVWQKIKPEESLEPTRQLGSNIVSHQLSFLQGHLPKTDEDVLDPTVNPPPGFKVLRRELRCSEAAPKVYEEVNQGNNETYSRIESELARRVDGHLYRFSKCNSSPEEPDEYFVSTAVWTNEPGHAVIVVETMTKALKPRAAYYHLLVDPLGESKKAKLIIEECSYHRYAKYYDASNTISFHFDSWSRGYEDVDRLIEAAKKEHDKLIDYELYDGCFFFGATPTQVNNTPKWVVDVFHQLKKDPIDHFPTKMQGLYWHEPHPSLKCKAYGLPSYKRRRNILTVTSSLSLLFGFACFSGACVGFTVGLSLAATSAVITPLAVGLISAAALLVGLGLIALGVCLGVRFLSELANPVSYANRLELLPRSQRQRAPELSPDRDDTGHELRPK